MTLCMLHAVWSLVNNEHYTMVKNVGKIVMFCFSDAMVEVKSDHSVAYCIRSNIDGTNI